MRRLTLLTIVNFAAFYFATIIFHEIVVKNISAIFFAGLILTVINFIIRPLIVLITLPVNIITLGLFTLVVNTWMVMLVDKLIKGIYIPGFWIAFGTSIIISALNMLVQKPLKGK